MDKIRVLGTPLAITGREVFAFREGYDSFHSGMDATEWTPTGGTVGIAWPREHRPEFVITIGETLRG